jgi:hypothetical protein
MITSIFQNSVPAPGTSTSSKQDSTRKIPPPDILLQLRCGSTLHQREVEELLRQASECVREHTLTKKDVAAANNQREKALAAQILLEISGDLPVPQEYYSKALATAAILERKGVLTQKEIAEARLHWEIRSEPTTTNISCAIELYNPRTCAARDIQSREGNKI